MRTMSLIIKAATALVALSVVFAQVTALGSQSRSEDEAKSALAECVRTHCIVGSAPVYDKPFAASATTRWRPPAESGRPELRSSIRYYRDRIGRLRIEQRFVGHAEGPQRIILVPEPKISTTYLLDPVARTSMTTGRNLAEMIVGGGGYNRFVLPLSTTRFVTLLQLPATDLESAQAVGEGSARRLIAGVWTTGTRFITELPGVKGSGRGERWVSAELQLVVYARSEDFKVGVLEYQLTDIDRAEPHAGLFEVPSDYVAAPAEGSLTWENPYAPPPNR